MSTNYVYLLSEPRLYTVGFYKPDGQWIAESDHDSRESAAERVAWLNGYPDGYPVGSLYLRDQVKP